LVGDVIKGALAVGLARIFCPHPAAAPVALLAVVIGHIWPVQLGFQGGKGLAPTLGGLLVFDPVLTGGLLALTLLCYGVIRRFGVSGLVALAVAPVLSCALRPPLETVTVALLAVLVLWAHRANIGRVFAAPAQPAAGSETAPDTP
jgi:glycerol-3-phosphate acyltransferase PlsY